MMDDSRAFEGWQRLGRAVTADIAGNDPGGLRQVRNELDEQERRYARAMAELAGEFCDGECSHVHYSHGEIARELGVTRQAVSKRIKAACGR